MKSRQSCTLMMVKATECTASLSRQAAHGGGITGVHLIVTKTRVLPEEVQICQTQTRIQTRNKD